MQVFNTITDLQSTLDDWRLQDQSIAFVPTMGGLHGGHLSLVDQALQVTDKVVVSIFVNPTQFNKNEDFDTYPDTLKQDLVLLESHQVDMVFTPSKDQIYPSGFQAKIKAGSLSKGLCGDSRSGHFDGVVQVIHRLFDIVSPDVAIFGQKDYQQLLVIRQMARAQSLDIRILSGDIVREDDGLAMSTRNQYLTLDQRGVAPELYIALQQLKSDILLTGEVDSQIINAKNSLSKYFKMDYLSVLDANTLTSITVNTGQIAILCAVFLGSIRLIDNIIFNKG